MERIKLDEFLQYHFLSNVRLSPNAKKAAFVVSRANEAKDGYDAGIWTVDLETRQCHQLTAGKDERSFVWLDDQTILFTSKRDSKKEDVDSFYTDCFQISLTGGEARKVMTLPAPVEALEKLDDDTWLLCVDYDGSLPEDFFLMSRESRKKLLADRKKEKDYSVFTELPFWRNGGGVTDKKRDRLYLYHVKAQELEPFTGPLYLMLDYSVSADKKHLLYVGSEFKGLQSLKQELVEVDLATGEADVLIPVSSWDIHHVEYAADKIVVTATENKEYGINENSNLYYYDRESRTLEEIAAPDRSWGSSVGSDCRLGGGRSMVAEQDGVTYITTERDWSKINHTDWQGNITSLTADEGSVDCMDKKGETLVYVAMRQNKLQELYCLTEQGEMQLSHINERIFEKKSVVTPKPLRITNDEGVEIDGWVLEPVDYDESKSYPAILDIHGGPKTVYGTCFMHEMQYWANEGYFVFFCNPRGGDGKGNEFADIRGPRYGVLDYNDLMEFTDVVLAKYPQIDPTRVGMTGGSYGGFMANWMVGHTDRFAAVASQRSISNFISKCLTTDIGYYHNLSAVQSDPWNSPEEMWNRSPLKYADKCKTPTLFIQSDEDYRCWMADALQMFTALRMHGVPTRVCLFHGENHELSRSGKPKHRVRRLKEITNWFDHYLKHE